MGCREPWSSAKAACSLKSWSSLRPLSVFEKRSPESQASLGLTMLSGMAVNFYLSCLLPSSSGIRGVCYNAWFKDYWDHAGQTCSIRVTFPAPRILRAWFSGSTVTLISIGFRGYHSGLLCNKYLWLRMGNWSLVKISLLQNVNIVSILIYVGKIKKKFLRVNVSMLYHAIMRTIGTVVIGYISL